MADWKNIGVPVLVALIAGTVSLISAYTNFITSSFFKPNIQISPDIQISNASAGELNDIVRIDITNNGTADAKSLRLTVQAPKDTSFTSFSTEKYSENKTVDPPRLEMYVPRFAQGTGSLIRIESLSQNLTGLNQAAMENETGGQQQSNQTSNQTSNQSAGGGQQQQQGNQSGSGLAQNETGGNETGGSILEQTGEAISKTFGDETGGSILEQTGEAISKTFGDENGNETTIRNYTVYVTYDQGSVAKVIPLLSEVRPLSTQINIFISQYGFTIGYFIIGTALVSFALWFYKKRVTGGFRRAKIMEVRPRKISPRKEKNFITILGSNFGPTGTVWLEYYPPVTEEEAIKHCPSFDDIDKVDEWIKRYRYQHDRLEYNYDITPKIAPTNALTRQDSRIITSLDDIIANLKSKERGARVMDGLLTYAISDAEYIVRVEKDGLLTYPTSDATFTITNFPPIAENLSYSTTLNEPVEIQLKATDPDADEQSKLTYVKVSDPKNGTLVFDSSTGIVTYTPNAYFIGEDTFTFKANDGKDDSNTATVKIIITS